MHPEIFPLSPARSPRRLAVLLGASALTSLFLAGAAQAADTTAAGALVANAGVAGHPAPIDAMSTDEWRRVLAVNLDGQFYTVRAVAGHMKSRGTG